MILTTLFLACSPSIKAHKAFHKAIVDPYELSLSDSAQCGARSGFAYQQMRGSKYQTQLAEFASLVDVSQEDWLQQSLFSTNDAVRTAAHNTLRMETALQLSCPAILQSIQYTDKEWKNEDVDRFVETHVPTFAPSPIELKDTVLRDEKTGKPFDYVIVGSGVSGSMVAHQLWEQGHRVLLLEMGHFPIPGAVDPRQMSNLRMELGGILSTDGNVAFETAQTLGGGGTINADLVFPPTSQLVQDKINAWREVGRIDSDQWTLEDMERANQAVSKLLGTRELDTTEINANNQVLWDGTLALGGNPDLYQLNRYIPSEAPSSISPKRSPIEQLLYPGMKDVENTLAVLPRARVERVVFSDEQSSTISHLEITMLKPTDQYGYQDDFHGIPLPQETTLTVPTKKVVLSAGTVGTALILQRSNLDNPNIGKGFNGHTSFPVLGVFDTEIQANDGVTASVYIDDYADDGFILESMSANAAYISTLFPGTPTENVKWTSTLQNMAGFGVMLVDTGAPTNYISQRPDGTVQLKYTLTSTDVDNLQKGIQKSIQTLFAAGARTVILPSREVKALGKSPVLTPNDSVEFLDDLTFESGYQTIISAHLMGSNKMGASLENSVVDFNHRVWGTDNLYIVDSSVFPTSPGANPMQTLYSLAWLWAEGQQ